MSSKNEKLALWHKHTAEALEIVLRDDNNIVNDLDDNSIVNSTELDVS